MKYKAVSSLLAALLAALLAGCGAKTACRCPAGRQPRAEIDPAGFHARHGGDH